MLKTLLSAVLVATQVMAWSASPLYVCLDADGAFCLDFGPQACDCCHAEAATCNATCQHDHDHGQSASGDTPCGCKHIQISEPQNATVARAVVLPDADQLVIPLLAVSPSAAGLLALNQPAAPDRAPDVFSTALTELSSVMLRC